MMIQSTTNIPVSGPRPAKTKLGAFFTDAYLMLFQFISRILNPAATTIRGGVMVPLRRVWDDFYPRVAFLEERVITPPSALTFIITVFLVLTEIKSQGQPGFPFETHPLLVRFSINSVVVFGLSSAAELVASGLDRDSVFVVISMARLGKICSLCILVTSLACLFYI